ncbi:MAG: hypothetical protein IKH45_08045 [Neisseriaceae bacterium]|nr:hypothetical protein [Neisseriaceae bacterium]MBR5675571.1 hypothetical protein [Neisseriaceae bacterium]
MLKKIIFAFVCGIVCFSAWAEEMNIKITVNQHKFSARLNSQTAAQEFFALLPLELEMTELNGNEKYHQFNGQKFTTQSKIIPQIENGDLMIFGNNYLVIFYKNFTQNNYAYTPIGKIDNPKDLANALGRGNVKVKIEK